MPINDQEVWRPDPGPPGCPTRITQTRVTPAGEEIVINLTDLLPDYCFFGQVGGLLPFLDKPATPKSDVVPPTKLK